MMRLYDEEELFKDALDYKVFEFIKGTIMAFNGLTLLYVKPPRNPQYIFDI